MPLPEQKLHEAFRTSRLNRVLGTGVSNYLATSMTINALPLDHGLSREKLVALREELVKNFIYANLTVDKKKLILENLIGETKSVKADNAGTDIQKEGLKKRSILLTRRISQLKDNVLKINRINSFIRSFNNNSLVLHEDKFKKIFEDLGVKDDDRRVRTLAQGQRSITVDLNKDLKELKAVNRELVHDRDQLLKEIAEIKESYGKNVHLFEEIVKLCNAGKLINEAQAGDDVDTMEVDQNNEEMEEDEEEEDHDEIEDRDIDIDGHD